MDNCKQRQSNPSKKTLALTSALFAWLLCSAACSYDAQPSAAASVLPAATNAAISCNQQVAVARPLQTLDYTLVAHYPHRSDAFSQGLIFIDGAIIESTGLYGRSSLALIPLGSTTPRVEVALDKTYFGEGLARLGDQLIQLTWKSGDVLRYQLTGTHTATPELTPLAAGKIEREGWGITTDGELLYTSDGSATLTVRHSETLQPLKTIAVEAMGRPLKKLNELEWVNGCILANIWGSDTIAVIDPRSGQSTHSIELGEIAQRERGRSPNNVANGIAFREDNGNLLVTGKNWQYIYELQFASQPR